MAFFGAIDSALVPTTPTTFDLGNAPETPKCGIGLFGDQATFGTENSDYKMSMGMTDAINDKCIVVNSANGVSPMQADRVQLDNAVCQRIPTGGGVSQTITHNSFLSDGWRLNLANPSATQKRFTGIMFGGSDLVNFEVGKVAFTNTPGAGEQTFSFADSSLNPNVMFFITAGTNVAGGVSDFALVCLGVAIKPEDTIIQRNINLRVDEDGATTSNPAATVRNDRVSGQATASTISIQWGAQLTKLIVGEFGLTPSIAAASGDEIIYLAMEITNQNIGLESITMPTGTGTFSVTSFGFQPSFSFSVFSMLQSFNTVVGDASSGVLSIGVGNESGDNICNAWRSADARTPSFNGSVVENTFIYCPYEDQTFIAPGSNATNGFESDSLTFIGDGWEVNMIAVNTGTRVAWSLAIGSKGRGKLIGGSLVNNGLIGGRLVC